VAIAASHKAPLRTTFQLLHIDTGVFGGGHDHMPKARPNKWVRFVYSLDQQMAFKYALSRED